MAADLIDLHTHTNCSDGDYAPAELLRLAKKRGVKTIAITDHDTVDGYDKELFLLAKELEIKLIPGIEFSTIDEESGQKIHALGLGIDSDNKALREKCARLRADRIKLMGQIAEKLAGCGFVLRVDELAASGEIITKAHIARDVLANEVNRRRLIKAHGNMPLQGEFIEKWLIKGCPAFVPKAKPLLTHEAIDIIHQASGISSCAHPSFNVMKGFSFENMEDTKKALQNIVKSMNKFENIVEKYTKKLSYSQKKITFGISFYGNKVDPRNIQNNKSNPQENK